MISAVEEAARRAYKDGQFLEVKFRASLESLKTKKERGPGYEHTNTSCDGKCWEASAFTKCICSCDRDNHGIATDPDRAEEYKALVISKLPAKEVPLALQKGAELKAKSQAAEEKERAEYEQEKAKWASIARVNGGCGAEIESRLDRMPCGTAVRTSNKNTTQVFCIECKACHRAKQQAEQAAIQAKRAAEQAAIQAAKALLPHRGSIFWFESPRGEHIPCGMPFNTQVRYCPECVLKRSKQLTER